MSTRAASSLFNYSNAFEHLCATRQLHLIWRKHISVSHGYNLCVRHFAFILTQTFVFWTLWITNQFYFDLFWAGYDSSLVWIAFGFAVWEWSWHLDLLSVYVQTSIRWSTIEFLEKAHLGVLQWQHQLELMSVQIAAFEWALDVNKNFISNLNSITCLPSTKTILEV